MAIPGTGIFKNCLWVNPLRYLGNTGYKNSIPVTYCVADGHNGTCPQVLGRVAEPCWVSMLQEWVEASDQCPPGQTLSTAKHPFLETVGIPASRLIAPGEVTS